MTLPDPLTGGDPIADIPQWTLDLRVALQHSTVSPTYESGWGDYFPTAVPPDQYLGLVVMKNPFDEVTICGMFARVGTSIAATTAEQHIATLPAGYRPARRVLLYMEFGGGPGRVDIYPDGRITARYRSAAAWNGSTGGGASWASLAGISYPAAP